MDLNKVQIIGNVTQDIEVKQTPTWKNVTSFSIATNRSWNDQNGMKQTQVEYHNIVLWWGLADIAWRYAKKWKKLYIEWRLQTRSWDAQDGTKRYKTEVIWENMILLWEKSWDEQSYSSSQAPQQAPVSNPTVTMNPTPARSSRPPKVEEEISIEDIPF